MQHGEWLQIMVGTQVRTWLILYSEWVVRDCFPLAESGKWLTLTSLGLGSCLGRLKMITMNQTRWLPTAGSCGDDDSSLAGLHPPHQHVNCCSLFWVLNSLLLGLSSFFTAELLERSPCRSQCKPLQPHFFCRF